MTRPIVIIGGTGFVGNHLIPALRARGEDVRASVRSRAAARHIMSAGAEPVLADIRVAHTLPGLLRGARGVVNLTTVTHERYRGEFVAVHAHGISNLLSACHQAGVDRIIHVGALGGARPLLPNDYLALKQLGTRLVLESGLSATIFETSIVFGPGDQHLSAIALALRILPIFPIPGIDAAETRFQPVFVGDLVNCIMAAFNDPTSSGCRFPLGGPRTFLYRELVEVVQEVLGIRRPIVNVPVTAIRILLWSSARIMRSPPLTTPMLDLAGMHSVADSLDTYLRFDVKPRQLEDEVYYLHTVGIRELMTWTLGRNNFPRMLSMCRRNSFQTRNCPRPER